MSGKDRTNRRLRVKHKKLIGELRYLYTDLEYHTEEHEFRKEEFNESFRDWCDEFGFDCSRPETRETFNEKKVQNWESKNGSSDNIN